MAELLQPIKSRFFTDANGNALAGGKVYTYEAGTTTPKQTFTDQTGATPNTNPIILDSNGEADIWLDSGSYKIRVDDSDDVTIYTVDQVSNVGPNDTDDLTEGSSNLYYTDARADARIALANFNDLVDVNISAPSDQQVVVWDSGTSRFIARNKTTRATYSSTSTADINDEIIELSGASFTLTLPTAVGNAGKEFTIYHAGTNFSQVYTIDGNGSETITPSRQSSNLTYNLYTNGESITIYSDGAGWRVKSNYAKTQWVDYTPTQQGFTAGPTYDVAKWMRDGSNIWMMLRITYTTRTNVELQINLPDTSLLIFTDDSTNATVLGQAEATGASGGDINVLGTDNDNYVNFSSDAVTPANADSLLAASQVLSFTVCVPVKNLNP